MSIISVSKELGINPFSKIHAKGKGNSLFTVSNNKQQKINSMITEKGNRRHTNISDFLRDEVVRTLDLPGTQEKAKKKNSLSSPSHLE